MTRILPILPCRAQVLHYLDIFVAAFVVSLAANQQHILDAHGLNAAKAAAFAAAVAGGKAVIEAYRKSAAKPPAATSPPSA